LMLSRAPVNTTPTCRSVSAMMARSSSIAARTSASCSPRYATRAASDVSSESAPQSTGPSARRSRSSLRTAEAIASPSPGPGAEAASYGYSSSHVSISRCRSSEMVPICLRSSSAFARSAPALSTAALLREEIFAERATSARSCP
jgi:hypothetical protein